MKNTFFEKNLTMPKKLKGGPFWDFSTSVLSENSKKIEGEPFGNFFFRKKVSQSQKYSKAVPLSFLDEVKVLLRKLLRQYFKFAE